jgi:hypothetical protein
MHRLEYGPRSAGGQNWSGAAAGYTAVCSCGKWTYDSIVWDPANAQDRSKAEAEHLKHEFAAI